MNDEVLKNIIIGAVGFTIIFGLGMLSDTGVFTSKKEKIKQSKYKDIYKLSSDLKKLNNLYEDGILNEDELEYKSIKIRSEKEALKLDLILSEDKTYLKLVTSLDEGLINEGEFIKKKNILTNKIKSEQQL